MTKAGGAEPCGGGGGYEALRRQSLRARYAYGFVFFATNLLAWFVRDYGARALRGLHHVPVCGAGDSKCFESGGVLRFTSLQNVQIFFWLMFATTFGTRKLHEARNSWHSGCWILKSLVYVLSIGIPFIIPNIFIQLYGEIARLGAGIFLLLQLISMLHFISWCNKRWMPDPGSNQCGLFGLFLSTICYIASFSGIGVLYFLYVPNSSCAFNIFTITWTAILVKIMMAMSLHSKVNEGLLSSGVMSAYIVFLCWSALHSEPQTGKCHSHMKIAKDGDWATIVSFIIAICSIVMATFSTGIDTKSFQFRNDEVQLEDDTPYSYEIFHIVFAMGAMYFAMLFISWELNHPTRKWSIDVGWASTWVKIINEWFAASIYIWKLISPIVSRNQFVDAEGFVPHRPTV
ncbi:putative serine incorporator [Panicum miliaceum]|uniref:Serine incorporator n=1 Tax=Panicum miliaceum TaxID=4540 RepID=A0A3L6PXW0_PANMI|nr:putative serine incorporator [Panicum miliaceum]